MEPVHRPDPAHRLALHAEFSMCPEADAQCHACPGMASVRPCCTGCLLQPPQDHAACGTSLSTGLLHAGSSAHPRMAGAGTARITAPGLCCPLHVCTQSGVEQTSRVAGAAGCLWVSSKTHRQHREPNEGVL